MKKLTSIGCMIFCGSQTFGNIEAGFSPDRILEISDDILKANCHSTQFHKGYPNIVLPSTWENDTYLKELSKNDYDLFFANNPCSGLSQINRSANLNAKPNSHFERVIHAIGVIQPKMAFLENSSMILSTGAPIIKKMINKLKDDYNFTIIRDKAGNHGCCMVRTRAFIIMWRKDCFNDQIPLLQMNKQPQTTIDEVLKNVGKKYNDTLFPEDQRSWTNVEDLYPLLKRGQNILEFMMENLDTYRDRLTKSQIKYVENSIKKLADGHNIWNKSPYKPDKIVPSLSSVIELINPITNRPFTIGELSAIMGYDSNKFEFLTPEVTAKLQEKDPSVPCATIPLTQMIGQGVPKNFIKYIHSEIKEALLGNRPFINKQPDEIVNFQNHITEFSQTFTLAQLDQMSKFEIDKKKATKLTK